MYKNGEKIINARNAGKPYDAVIIDSVNGSNFISLDPKNIRSINARFDPSKKNSANLMAGAAGGGGASCRQRCGGRGRTTATCGTTTRRQEATDRARYAESRAQRSVSVRQREEIQEVSRSERIVTT